MCEKYSRWCDLQHNGKDCCFYYQRWLSKQTRTRKGLFARAIARDGAECRWCGALQMLTKDHVIPVSKGGPNVLANIQVLCRECNELKGDLLPTSEECLRLQRRRERLRSRNLRVHAHAHEHAHTA